MVRYALVVGINEYQHPISQLTRPAVGAEAFANILVQSGRCQQVKRLIGTVTSKELTDAIKNLLEYQAEGEEILFYYSGHAVKVVDTLDEANAIFVPSDCLVRLDEQGNATAHTRGISFESFNKKVGKSNVSRLVTILDCCHGGDLIERAMLQDIFTVFESRSSDYLLISGCKGYEKARAKLDREYSVFTEALLSGLANDKADSKGQIRGGGLFDHISGQLQGTDQEAIYLGGGRSIAIVEYALSEEGLAYQVNEECPYQGLNAFEKDQTEFFFGRELLVEKIRRNIDLQPFIPIIGASGSGKSSVVRAGLLPLLEKENLGGTVSQWQILGLGTQGDPIKPGVNPLLELTKVLEPFYRSKRDIQHLHSSIEKGSKDLSELVQKIPGNSRLVLVVDQFEEVFTVCPSEHQRQRFIELLTQVDSEYNRLVVITTMRADFLEPCLNYPELHNLIQNQAIFMPPLTPEHVRAIIEKPARVQGHTIEESLTAQLLSDMAKQPGALPLLEFALTQIWEQRDKENHQLTLAAYQSLGTDKSDKEPKGKEKAGLVRALNLHAEKVYLYQDFWEETSAEPRKPEEKEWIKQIFLRLVRVGKGEKDTRQRQPKQVLLALAGNDCDKKEALLELLEGETGLVKGRLLVTGKVDEKDESSWVDLAHEALIGGWGTFSEWLEESREIRRVRDRVEDLFYEWEKSGRKEGNLVMGSFLSQVVDCQARLDLGGDEPLLKFIQDSIQHRERQEKERLDLLKNQAYSEINALVSLSNAQLSLNDQLPSLETALVAAKRLAELPSAPSEIRERVTDSLRQIVPSIQERNRFYGHSKQIEDVVFALDRSLVLSSGADRTVFVWSCHGELLAKLTGHTAWVNSLSVIPKTDKSFLLVSGSSDKLVKLWWIVYNSQKENPIQVQRTEDLIGHEGWILDTDVSPQGNLIASSGREGAVKIWTATGDLVSTLQIASKNESAKEVWSVSFSPDGKAIATAGEDGIVRLWNLEGELIQEFIGHMHRARTVMFSPKGNMLASGSDDSSLILWDTSGNQLNRITDFDGHVNCIRFSSDGSVIAAASDDRTVKLFDNRGYLLKVLRGHESRVKSISFSSDDSMLATVSWDETVRLWSLTQQIQMVIRHHTDRVLDVNFSNDGERIVTASWDTSACIWDLSGERLHTLEDHVDKVNGANFSPDGRLVVTVGSTKDRTAKIWNSDGSLRQSLEGHESYIRDPSFSPDGSLIVTAGGDRTVRLWTSEGEEYAVLGGTADEESSHASEVRGVSFSPDGECIASGAKDGTVKLWTRSGDLVNSFLAHDQEIWNVVFSPDCEADGCYLLATASEDKTVRIWKIKKEANWQICSAPCMTLIGHTDRVSDIEFSHCGRIMATAGADKTVRLWSRRGTLLATLEGHTDRVMAVAFHKDSQLLASAAVDDSVIVWNIEAQVEMAELDRTDRDAAALSELETFTKRGREWLYDFVRYSKRTDRESSI
jgi:WD40 repeat protein